MDDFYVLSNGKEFAAFYNSGAVYKTEDFSEANHLSTFESADRWLKEESKYLQGFSVYQVSITPV